MGSYLSEPVTAKQSEDGESAGRPHAASAMQGWRKTMEDAHLAGVGLPGERELFAVFDGHGGREVAAFCARHLARELAASSAFKAGELSDALVASFHRMDELLRDKRYRSELARLRKASNAEEDGGLDMVGICDGDEGKAAQDREGDAATVANGVAGATDDRAKPPNDDNLARNGAGEGAEHATDSDESMSAKSMRESMQADVREQMQAAEEKGSLSKAEALDLVMKMMRLQKLESAERENADEPGLSATDALYGPGCATGAGCTAVVAVLDNQSKKLFVANAGDSRGVLSSAGTAKALSEDHKPRDERELARINAAGGKVNEMGRVNGNLNLSRSIGDLQYKQNKSLPPAEQIITAEPDVRVFDLSDEDEFFVLACDGVFDVMTNERLISFVRERIVAGVTPLSKILEDVFDECICESPGESQGLGADNMTALLVLLKPVSEFAGQ